MKERTKFEAVVITGIIPKGFLSFCYKLLMVTPENKDLKQNWQHEFNCVFELKSWLHWFNSGINLPCNVNIKENSFKCTRGGLISQLNCARCMVVQAKAGNVKRLIQDLTMHWSRIKIKPSWTMISQQILAITNCQLKLLPRVFLLNMLEVKRGSEDL